MRILVTGGAGYIGSHTCVELLEAGYEVVVVDNLYNASEKALERVKQITGKDLTFYLADICDRDMMNKIFDQEHVDAVIHFAGLKAVGESVAKPIEYYSNNPGGNADSLRCDAKSRGEKHYLQLLRYGIRRSRLCADHRGMPQGYLHQPLRLDQMDAGAGAYRHSEGRSGVECDPASLFQPHRRP